MLMENIPSRSSVGAAHRIPDKPVIALFDFDHTLTDRHTFWRFLRLLVGSVRFWSALVPMTLPLWGWVIGRVPLLTLREQIIEHFLAGFPAEEFERQGRRFAEGYLPPWIRPEALARLRWHQNQGHRTLLISNSPEVYLLPLSRSLHIDGVMGSRFEIVDRHLTGRLQGTHCYGPEKIARLKAELGDLSRYRLYAYGDSSGDRELLEAADFAFYRTFQDTMA